MAVPAIPKKRRSLSERVRFVLARAGPFRVALFVLILLYIWIFTALAFGQHAGMRTHKADLGQIDQAVWNSSRGRFVEMTDNGYVSSRLIDHVEPILAIVSPVFWVWDDVRAILLLQVVFVAAGAWLLFELALVQLDRLLSREERRRVWLAEPVQRLAGWVALALAIAFLLAPHLQSAVLTEFHAIPLATPLILWAFWAIASERWGQFTVATVLVALVKEEAALLAAALGAWAMWRIVWEYHAAQDTKRDSFAWGPMALAAGVAVVSLAWFYVATFVIVPAHAVGVYGIEESNYFQRYGALGDTPVDIVTSLVTQPGLVWSIAMEPARVAYLRGLAMPFGFMTLLAPEVVLLSLPVLLANLLSAYPAQYYGEFHYSAPVVTFFAAGAAYGAARLWRWASRRTARMSGDFQHMPAAGVTTMTAVAALRNSRAALRPAVTAALSVWIVAWAMVAYFAFGRGPAGGRYDVTLVTAHHEVLDRFVAQLPDGAPVTATAAVHPHVSHRRYVYQFPTGLGSDVPAEWALLDMTTATDMAPGDVRTTVEAMLADGWGVVDAADGFLLLHQGTAQKTLPESFYDFARVHAEDGTECDAPLCFAGATVQDWPRWRRSTVTTRWRVGAGFDGASMQPQIEVRTPAGETLYRFADATPPALVWYPPQQWKAGDEVTITTLPLQLPRDFGVVVEATPGLEMSDAIAVGADGSALAAAYRRGHGDTLYELAADLTDANGWADWFAEEMGEPVTGADAVIRLSDGRQVSLSARLAERAYWPADAVDVWLSWVSEVDWPEGMEAFVHLRADGANVAQNDGTPRYFVTYDMQDVLGASRRISDWRQLAIPVDIDVDASVRWSVAVGLYDPVSGERATVYGADGTMIGNELVIDGLDVGSTPAPDQTCALIPEACASQRE